MKPGCVAWTTEPGAGSEPVIKSEIATNRNSRTLDQWVVYYQESIGKDWEAKRVAWSGVTPPPISCPRMLP